MAWRTNDGRYRSWIALTLAIVASTVLPTDVAHAFEDGHFGGGPGHFGYFGGEPGHFEHGRPWGFEHPAGRWDWGRHGVDVDRWHGGHWFHGEHLGRAGWWWVVGDGWYFYPAPVYPYPDPYVPPAAVSLSAGYWYYCGSANAYYPYVTQCPEGWKPVVPQAPQS